MCIGAFIFFLKISYSLLLGMWIWWIVVNRYIEKGLFKIIVSTILVCKCVEGGYKINSDGDRDVNYFLSVFLIFFTTHYTLRFTSPYTFCIPFIHTLLVDNFI